MVALNVPIPICDIPERVHGASAVFEVIYRNGVSRDFIGVIHSVSGLFDDMVNRLYRDGSIMYIGVSLKSGRFVCEAYLD